MVKVVFVGDQPSKTNCCDNLAFVGARCFDTVIKWIKNVNADYYTCINSSRSFEILKVIRLKHEGFKVIALGQKASARLNKSKVEHYELPHPSGLNRKLNNKQWVEHQLVGAYLYVRR